MNRDDCRETGGSRGTGAESRTRSDADDGRGGVASAIGHAFGGTGRSAAIVVGGLVAMALIAGAGAASATTPGGDAGSGGPAAAQMADADGGSGGDGWWGSASGSSGGWFGESASAGSGDDDGGDGSSGWWGQSQGSDAGSGSWWGQGDGSAGTGGQGDGSTGTDGGQADTGGQVGTGGWQGDGGIGGEPGQLDRARLERLVHEGVNEARAENGLGPLSFDEGLREIARSHSEDMAANDYFSHTSPAGETMTDRYRAHGYECRVPLGEYRYATGAENIFMYGSTAVSEEELADVVVSGWMDSEGHRRNILDENLRREGIGVAISDGGAVYVTENFC